MKKIVFFLVLFLCCTLGYAQRKRVLNLSNYDHKLFHWGFSLGINTVDYGLRFHPTMGDNPAYEHNGAWKDDAEQVVSSDKLRADLMTIKSGFTVAIVTDFRLGRYFNLRFLPGLSFGERQLTYTRNGEYMPIYNIYTGSDDQQTITVNSTFLDFPLLVKYKSSRLNNQKPYILAGMAYRQDVSRTGEEDLINLHGGSWYAEFGVGLDSYLPFFKFSTELKFSIGLNSLIADAPTEQRAYYAQSIQSITSNIFTLSFHFE